MFKKIVCLGLMLIMSIGGFTACAGGKKIKFELVEGYDFGYNAEGKYALSMILRSTAELSTLCSDRYERDDTDMEKLSKKEKWGDILENYNETYFGDNALIIYSGIAGASNWRIKSLRKKGATLSINVRFASSGGGIGMSPAIVKAIPFVFLIEVKKGDIIGVNNIEVK